MSDISTTNDTIVRYQGVGTEDTYSYSFTNYDEDFSTVEACVVDADRVEDTDYTYTLGESNTVTLNQDLATDRYLEIYLVTNDTPNTVFDSSSKRLTDTNMNDVINQLMVTAQEAKDGRNNPQIFPMDLNSQRIMNVADGVNMGDAVNMQQLSDAVGNIDDQVERAETAATEAEASATAAATSASEASDSAAAALVSETNAAASEEAVLLQFKGEWDPDYIGNVGTGYDTADLALYDNNLWYSNFDENEDFPDVGSELPTPTWSLYLPGSADTEELVAKIYRATFNGDGITTEFDLTANNVLFKPTSSTQIFYVSVDQEETIDFTISVDGVTGHSMITFTSAPPANDDPDGVYNILVIGATPKFFDVEGLPSDPVDEDYLQYDETTGKYVGRTASEVAADLGVTLNDSKIAISKPINDTITWTSATTIEWYGDCLADDDETILSAESGSPLTATLSGAVASTSYYMFIGLDSGSATVAEFDTNEDGSGLSTIVGAKRLVSPKIGFRTDSSGNLLDFKFENERYEVRIFSGEISSETTFSIYDEYTKYDNIEIAMGDNTTSTGLQYFPVSTRSFAGVTSGVPFRMSTGSSGTTRVLILYPASTTSITISDRASANLFYVDAVYYGKR